MIKLQIVFIEIRYTFKLKYKFNIDYFNLKKLYYSICTLMTKFGLMTN